MNRRISLILAAMISLALVQSRAFSSYVKRDLFAYWSFDGVTIQGQTVKDIAGNNDATMDGGPKIIPGRHGQAIEFDGKRSYLDLGLKEFGSKLRTFTVEFWIQTEVTGTFTSLFKTLNAEDSVGWSIDLNRSGGGGFPYKVEATFPFIRDKAGKSLSAEILNDIYDCEWHHFAWVVENAAGNATQIYVDGNAQKVIFGTRGSPAALGEFQYTVFLGAANNRGRAEAFCPAAVDEFRLYTRALTSGEVNQNLQSGAAVDYLGKLPVLWCELRSDKQ